MFLRYSDIAKGGEPQIRPQALLVLGVATGWCRAARRIRAERAKLGGRVDAADHGNWTRLVLAIERRWFVRVELAGR